MKKVNLFAIIVLLSVVLNACKKDAGEGGNSSITGYVHMTVYNSTFVTPLSNYSAADVDVYIIYGDETSIGDRIRTNPDGRFEFKYLRPGNYRVYVYSEGNIITYPSGNYAETKDVEITKKKQTVDCGTFEIKED